MTDSKTALDHALVHMKIITEDGLTLDCKDSIVYFIRRLREAAKSQKHKIATFAGDGLILDIERLAKECNVDLQMFLDSLNSSLNYEVHWQGVIQSVRDYIHWTAPGLDKMTLNDVTHLARMALAGEGDWATVQNIIFRWHLQKQGFNALNDFFKCRKLRKYDFNGLCLKILSIDSCILMLTLRHDVIWTDKIEDRVLELLQQQQKLFVFDVRSDDDFHQKQRIVTSYWSARQPVLLVDEVDLLVAAIRRDSFTEKATHFLKMIREETEILTAIFQMNLGEQIVLDANSLSDRGKFLLQTVVCDYRDCPLWGSAQCSQKIAQTCETETFHYYTIRRWKEFCRPLLKRLNMLRYEFSEQFCDTCHKQYKELEDQIEPHRNFFVTYEWQNRIVMYRAKFADQEFATGHFAEVRNQAVRLKKMTSDLVQTLLTDAREFDNWLNGREIDPAKIIHHNSHHLLTTMPDPSVD
jgi:hypothetical protein